MIGTLTESEYDGYFYNSSLLISPALTEIYKLDIRDEYEDAIAQYIEYLTTSNPTTHPEIVKDFFLFEDNFVLLRFRKKYSNDYL